MPGVIIGWAEYERGVDQTWLAAGEVNLGYNIFPGFRGRGYATRAVRLLLQLLATEPAFETALLTISEENAASLKVATRAGFVECASHGGGCRYFKRHIRTGQDDG